MQMAQALRNGVSGWLRGVSYAPPASTASMALSTADPTYDSSAIAEPVSGGYARQPVTFGALGTVGDVRAVSNDIAVTFNATASWGSVTHGVLYYGSVALWQGPLNAQKLVDAGDSISFNAGSIELSAGVRWSNYSRDLILNVASGGSLTASSGLFVALFTGDPGPDGSALAEPTGNYDRQEITFAETSNTSAGIILGNSSALVFGAASTNWGSISHVGIFDAAFGGNIVAYGPAAIQRNIESGDAYAIGVDALSLTVR